MKVETKKLPKSTLQLNISVPVDKVKETYNEVLVDFSKSVEIKGFRKGNAPKDLVEKSLDPAKVNGEVVNKLLEKYYIQALKENKINPLSNPKVEIKKFNLEEDFEFVASVAVRPEVKVGDYKDALKKKLEERKKEAGKLKEEALKKGEDMKQIHDHLHTNEIIKIIVDSAEIVVPELLVEDEVNRMRARLIDQMGTLNMTMEQYLQAQGKTGEQLNAEFENNAEENLKAEFVLAQAVKDAGIEVQDVEIEEAAKASGDPVALENLKDPVHKWYIKSILEKNKLLAGIMEELEGRGEQEQEEESKEEK